MRAAEQTRVVRRPAEGGRAGDAVERPFEGERGEVGADYTDAPAEA